MTLRSQSGFTLVESILAFSVLTAILAMVSLKVNSVRSHIKKTEQILALDALELWLTPILSDYETLSFSSTFLRSRTLENCLTGRSACRSGSTFQFALYLKGQKEPLTGPSSAYDRNGSLCTEEKCGEYKILSQVRVNCLSGGTCRNSEFLNVRFDMIRIRDNKRIRTRFIETSKRKNNRFPNLSIRCPGQQILRGVGINGEALCVRQEDIVFQNSRGESLTGTVEVKNKDCRDGNQDQNRDQNFVLGMDQNGNLLCDERFW